jgi:hypothetical protein
MGIDEFYRDLNVSQIMFMREVDGFLGMLEVAGFEFASGPRFI